MLVRGLSVASMVLWYDAAVRWIKYGRSEVATSEDAKLTVFWAVTVLHAGAFCAAGLEQLKSAVKARAAGKPLGAVAGEATGGRHGRCDDLFAECVVAYSGLLQDPLYIMCKVQRMKCKV